jgi:hypothetical protein
MTAAAEAKQITAGCVTTTARIVQPRACTRMLKTVCRKGWPPRMQHVTYLNGKMRCRRCSQLPQSRHPIGNHLYSSSNSTSTESDLQVGGGGGRAAVVPPPTASRDRCLYCCIFNPAWPWCHLSDLLTCCGSQALNTKHHTPPRIVRAGKQGLPTVL